MSAGRMRGPWLRGAPRWVALALLSMTLGAAAGTAGAARATTRNAVGPAATPPRRVYSIKDSPGYVPAFDPESSSVVIGRRMNAPAVSQRFQGGARSLDALGRAVCRSLHREDRDSLAALCVREDEFRDVLWREFPQSRPATGLTWEDGWRVLGLRLTAGCSEAIHDLGGHHYEFLRLEADSTMAYRNFKLHSRLTLVARDDEGQTRRMTWMRAVAERKGVFKIVSTTD